jgi:hypothetical protein
VLPVQANGTRLTGSRNLDFKLADQLAGFPGGKRPQYFTWHHNQKLGTMELVDQKIHAATGHAGGVALWEKLFDQKYQ